MQKPKRTHIEREPLVSDPAPNPAPDQVDEVPAEGAEVVHDGGPSDEGEPAEVTGAPLGDGAAEPAVYTLTKTTTGFALVVSTDGHPAEGEQRTFSYRPAPASLEQALREPFLVVTCPLDSVQAVVCWHRDQGYGVLSTSAYQKGTGVGSGIEVMLTFGED